MEIQELANILLTVFLLVFIPMMFWLYKGKPKKEIEKKYPWKIRMYYIPFYDGWKKVVSAEDRILFEEFIFRGNISWVVLVIFELSVLALKIYGSFSLMEFYYGEN